MSNNIVDTTQPLKTNQNIQPKRVENYVGGTCMCMFLLWVQF